VHIQIVEFEPPAGYSNRYAVVYCCFSDCQIASLPDCQFARLHTQTGAKIYRWFSRERAATFSGWPVICEPQICNEKLMSGFKG